MKEKKLKSVLPRKIEFIVPYSELKTRVQKLLSFITENEVVILLSNQILDKAESIYLEFRQNSDFFYFTGLEIQPAILVFSKKEAFLFYDPPKPEEEIWTGIQPNYKEIKQYLPYINAIYPFKEYKEKLPDLIKNQTKIYYPFGNNQEFDLWILKFLESKLRKGRTGIFYPISIEHLYHLMFELRIQKSEYEIQTIKEIMKITKEAHINVWKETKPNRKEYELDSLLWKTFKKYNAKPAYPNIVASGPNACILHYTKNSRTIKKNELVLIDAGASKFYLNTDITRTYPSSGKFNSVQKHLYYAVLSAQKKAIENVKPGNCMEDIHYTTLLTLIDFLKQEKILKDSKETIIEKELYKKYYMHRTGHWLGYDVHDSGFYVCYPNTKKENVCNSQFHSKFKHEFANQLYRKFEPNMICTVEPGLYFSPKDDSIPKEWRGIGIRIEDDVLVTETDPEVLSKEIPKSIEEIEAIMQS